MYAVTGVTGQVGGAAARTLLANGQAVRAIVREAEKARSWEKSGVELAIADYRDANALTTAVTGVEGVFVMIPSNFAPQLDLLETRAIFAHCVRRSTRLDPRKPCICPPSVRHGPKARA
jgi:NAD(P)H dehydrogenase (quinone)